MSEVAEIQTTVIRNQRGLSIAGTRITLYDVMDYVTDDWPPKLIQCWLNLSDRQIADVMAYIDEHRDAVEKEYQQVLQKAEQNRQYWESKNRHRFEKVADRADTPAQQKIRAKLKAHKEKLKLGQL